MRLSPPPPPHLQCIKEEGDVEKGEPGVVLPHACARYTYDTCTMHVSYTYVCVSGPWS